MTGVQTCALPICRHRPRPARDARLTVPLSTAGLVLDWQGMRAQSRPMARCVSGPIGTVDAIAESVQRRHAPQQFSLGNWSSEVRRSSAFVEATAASVARKAPFARAADVDLLATRVFVSTVDRFCGAPSYSTCSTRPIPTANSLIATRRRHTGSGQRDSAIWRTASLLFMRAVGRGMKTNVAQAYRYLTQYWERVNPFTFSGSAVALSRLARSSACCGRRD